MVPNVMTLFGIIIQRKILSNLLHINDVVMALGQASVMAVLQFQSTNGAVDFLKNEENKKELFSFISRQIK